MTIYVTAEGRRRPGHKDRGRRRLPPPWFHETDSDVRYGSETVVTSTSALMVNTSVAVFDAYVYADQPDGGGGTEAMNGPATWFWPLVTRVVGAVGPAAPVG